MQPDGKILLAGYGSARFQTQNIVLLRFISSGSLDSTFGGGTGKVATDFGTSDDIGTAMALQPDGKVLVAGSTNVGSSYDFALVRYNPNGTLDTTFNGSGKVVTDFGGRSDTGTSVVRQSNNKIVVAGYSYDGAKYDFAVARYNADGSLDSTFNGTGKAILSVGSGSSFAFGMALQADNKIVIAGDAETSSSADFAVVRCNNGLTAAQAWRLHYFGTPDNSGNAADDATPDDDGIKNLLKYALVLAPGTNGAAFLPRGQLREYAEGERLALTFTRDQFRNDITLSVEAANTLSGPWTTIAASSGGGIFSGSGFVTETDAGNGLKIVEVRDTVNLADAARRFLRIKVTR